MLDIWMPCAAHAEMLTLLRREWDRARAGSAQARAAGGAMQPENLTSVRRVAREVLAQVAPMGPLIWQSVPCTASDVQAGKALHQPVPRTIPMQYRGVLSAVGSWLHARYTSDVVSVVQLDSRIESLTARQRERHPAVERPRVSQGSDRFSGPFQMQGAPPILLQNCMVSFGQFLGRFSCLLCSTRGNRLCSQQCLCCHEER